jgi:hypothetical protein
MKKVMNRITILCARLLLPCLCLATAGCMGPNPWTVDPYADCRSLGLIPGTMRFEECLLVNKELQAGRAAPATPQKSSADSDAAASQRLQTRACDPTTGLCSPVLLQK